MNSVTNTILLCILINAAIINFTLLRIEKKIKESSSDDGNYAGRVRRTGKETIQSLASARDIHIYPPNAMFLMQIPSRGIRKQK